MNLPQAPDCACRTPAALNPRECPLWMEHLWQSRSSVGQTCALLRARRRWRSRRRRAARCLRPSSTRRGSTRASCSCRGAPPLCTSWTATPSPATCPPRCAAPRPTARPCARPRSPAACRPGSRSPCCSCRPALRRRSRPPCCSCRPRPRYPLLLVGLPRNCALEPYTPAVLAVGDRLAHACSSCSSTSISPLH